MSKNTNNLLTILIFILIIFCLYTYPNPTAVNTLFNNIKENILTIVKNINKNTTQILKELDSNSSNSNSSSLESLSLSTTNLTTNQVFKYYKMLDSNSQILYKQLCTNIEKYQITITPTTKINSTQVALTFEAVFDDHPEYFWLDNNYSYEYDDTGNITKITLNYNDTINYIEEAKIKFNNAANKIILAANKLNSAYEKEKYVHDTIITNTTFDEDALLNQSAYSALVNGSSVCAGYARAFQYIMNKLGISTTYVTGYANEEHAWNIVTLEYGTYNVDLTWDDKNGISYDYFNFPDTIFNKTHTRTGLSLNLPKCETTLYSSTTSLENKMTLPTYNSASPNS